MPTSPNPVCKDCTSRSVANGYCLKHQTNNNATMNERLFDQYRADDPIRQLYRTRGWIKGTRLRVLRRDILCVACGHRIATEADHILSARLVVDNFGIDEFYNPDRCQGLCHTCHSSKTALECGWAGKRGTRLDTLQPRTNTTVVCGPSGSGKTTHVLNHKQADDLVWDYNEVMASITGLPLYQSLPGAVGSVLANRDAFIESTARSPHHVWIIVCNPNAVIVRLLIESGADLITLDTPDEVCEQRLAERLRTLL